MSDEEESFTKSSGKSDREPLIAEPRPRLEWDQLPEEFLVQVGVHLGSVLSPLLFAIVMDVIVKNVTAGLMNKLFYANDLVLMSESTKNLRDKFLKWREAFESKKLKFNLKKDKVMVSGSKEEILESKVDPCAKCGKMAMANSRSAVNVWVVNIQYIKMKRVILTVAKGFICERCVGAMKGTIEPAEEVIFYDQVELVLAYLGPVVEVKQR